MKKHHEVTIEIFKGLRPGRVLDAGSGSEMLGRALSGLGFDVVSLDLFPAGGRMKKFIKADMNRHLPLADSSFDYVLCSESLQYIENHARLMREFARVLRKGGSAVLSMPNTLNASSRLYFLKRGYFPHFKPVRAVDASKGWDAVAYNPCSFVEIDSLARGCGLRTVEVRPSRTRLRCYPLYVLLKTLYSIGSAFGRNGNGCAEKARLLGHLSSRELLLGDHLVLRLLRGPESGRPDRVL